MRKILLTALSVAIIGAGPAPAATVADRYSSYWALGDSLSDNGNLSWVAWTGANWLGSGGPTSSSTGSNAYYNTGSWWSPDVRFTNGKVWTEHVADAFRAQGLATGNYAYGGAQASPDGLWDAIDPTPELQWQRDKLLSSKRGSFGTRPLVSLLAGANDIFGSVGDADILTTAVEAAKSVGSIARSLAQNGVRDFIIGNLPDIGRTPRFTLIETAAQSAATQASLAFNAQLETEIAGLAAAGSNIVKLDLYSIMDRMLADPARYGFNDVTHPCYYHDSAVAAAQGDRQRCTASESRTHLFFDEVHPNLLAHQQVGAAVLKQLTTEPEPMPSLFAASSLRVSSQPMAFAAVAPVPLPAGAPLLLVALAGLAGLGRRRRA